MAVTSILNALLFKEKPELPSLDRLELGTEQQKAIAANQAALSGTQSLASQVNAFNQSELMKTLRDVLPGLDEKMGLAGEGLERGLRGELPISDANMIRDRSIARSLSGGTGGLESGYGRALVGRDLGIASNDLFMKSLGAFESWLQVGRQALTAPQFDVTSMFISPAQQAAFDVSERNTLWNYNWFKNQLDAQPEPWEAAVGGLMDWVANTGLSAATMGLGGLGGMGGAGTGGSGSGAGGSTAGVTGGGSTGNVRTYGQVY